MLLWVRLLSGNNAGKIIVHVFGIILKKIWWDLILKSVAVSHKNWKIYFLKSMGDLFSLRAVFRPKALCKKLFLKFTQLIFTWFSEKSCYCLQQQCKTGP